MNNCGLGSLDTYMGNYSVSTIPGTNVSVIKIIFLVKCSLVLYSSNFTSVQDDFEQSDELIDFTMICFSFIFVYLYSMTCRNNVSISNFSLMVSEVFQKDPDKQKKKKKMKEKREFLLQILTDNLQVKKFNTCFPSNSYRETRHVVIEKIISHRYLKISLFAYFNLKINKTFCIIWLTIIIKELKITNRRNLKHTLVI
ncbi:Uncharacterized protein FWK35_00005950 [Aphis craccivora]|uniref:Uncharacterized protein n=1 Tax=Aphis craccivora TaxID=307492 RepID=A0A6G0ZM07_APHCR|nr:Uncharacterized protein FWK35_00005950 [Aphis craccivora]